MDSTEEVRQVLQKFQDGYTARDVSKLDEFMELFAPGDEAEMVGIGAYNRGENEWPAGRARLREIIESDWRYWGNVALDVAGARISTRQEAAWFSTTVKLISTAQFEDAMPFYLNTMKELLEAEDETTAQRMMNASFWGIGRLRDEMRGVGYAWPLTLTGVLVKSTQGWQIHLLHFAVKAE